MTKADAEDTTASSGKTPSDTGRENEVSPEDSSTVPGWMIVVVSGFGGIIAVCGVVLTVFLKKRKNKYSVCVCS